jgi:rubrerythrin
MYPMMQNEAVQEGWVDSAMMAQEQIDESKQHSEEFMAILTKAERRFNALKGVEKRHAAAYQSKLETL